MEQVCEQCGQAKALQPVPAYDFDLAGMPVTLVDAVEVLTCECGSHQDSVFIPNMKGLKATAALTRALYPQRLCGVEIRSLRKAMDYSAKEMAKRLEVEPETLSRWENDRKPMGPTSEKLLRMLVATRMKDEAPLVVFDLEELGGLDIQGFARPDCPVRFSFQLMRKVVVPNKKLATSDEYQEKKAA